MKGIGTNNETNIETSKQPKQAKVSKDGTRRGQNPNSKKNLSVPEKGEVRNPNGRPQGIIDFRKRVEFSIKFLAEQYVEKHNLDPKNASKQITIDDVDIMGDVFSQLINQARNGNIKAIDSLMDRVYGKAKQPVELTGANGGAIEHSVEMANAEAEVDQWIEGWVKVKKQDDHKPDTGTEGETKDK